MPYKAASLFSGIGGLDLAFAWAGFNVVFQCEIDPYCQQVLNKWRSTYWPNARLHEDITNVQKTDVGKVDIMFGGFPCFVAGTMVLTIGGYRTIESLKVGDLVLTYKGNWHPILSIMKRENAKVRTIKAQSTLPITTTDEHPFWAREYRQVWDKTRTYKREFDTPEWVNAKCLERGHMVSQVLPERIEDIIHKSPEFWWLVGRYLADGWRVNRKDRKAGSGRVVICCNHREANELKSRIKAAGFNASEEIQRTATRYHIVHNKFYQFLEQFGHKAHGKTLPGWCLSLPQNKAEALILGYLTGDGSRYKNKQGKEAGWAATTVSHSLALGIVLLAQRAWGCVASLYKWNVSPKTIIEGRTVNQRPQYQIQIPDSNRSNFVEDNYGWKRITANEINAKTATVYNIEVAADNSYVVANTCVHNCQDISVAGKQAGIAVGTRSGLWFEFLRLISEIRPRVVLLENVAAILTTGGDIVLNTLAEIGYDTQWTLIRASDIGAPHQRERWFCVAYACTGGRKAPFQSEQTRRIPQLADTTSTGSSQRQQTGRRAHTAQARRGLGHSGFKRCSKLAVASRQRCHSGRDYRGRRFLARNERATAQYASSRPAGSHFKPGLGRASHGLSGRLDRHQRISRRDYHAQRWPARPDATQYDYEPTRVTDRKEHRVNRVKALGNAVVPQQAYPFALAIHEFLDSQIRTN